MSNPSHTEPLPLNDDFGCLFDPVTGAIVLEGPLDAETAPILVSHWNNPAWHASPWHSDGGAAQVLDCRAVTLLAAAGVTALLAIAGRARPVLIASTPVLETLDRCGLTCRFDLHSA